MWLVSGSGLVAAGTLTLTLEPSLDGKVDSITLGTTLLMQGQEIVDIYPSRNHDEKIVISWIRE
jgi:hypothetical protein